ncbi:MAG: 3'-5' exonuclease [Bacteroidota bacterium]
MRLNLIRPLAFFDLETTGTNVATDRIVQIAAIKILPDGSDEKFDTLVNPNIPIPEETSLIHGIYDEDVKDKPAFKEITGELIQFLENCDLAGYNSNKFDLPLLAEEFLRNNIEFKVKDRKLVDVQNIFHKMEKRTLKAAYKFYTGKIQENAHNAMSDVEATYEILLAQIEKYDGKEYHSEESDCLTPIQNNIEMLHEFSSTKKNVDFAGRIVFNKDNMEVFNFGKHKGKPVEEVFKTEPSYYSWMMKGDFPLYTKKVITEIKSRLN